MDGVTLQDRLSRGMGAAARVFGLPYDVFRPHGVCAPMASERRVLRMHAAFDGGDPGYRRPRGYERALRGTFDADCVRVGDYLVGERGVLFIAGLPALARPLCVLTTGVIDVVRPLGAGLPGLNGYGGVVEERLRAVLSGWPAQVLDGVAGMRGALPADVGLPGWSVLLPVTPVSIHASDVLRDEVGRRFVVRVAERSELGWRLVVREAGV